MYSTTSRTMSREFTGPPSIWPPPVRLAAISPVNFHGCSNARTTNAPHKGVARWRFQPWPSSLIVYTWRGFGTVAAPTHDDKIIGSHRASRQWFLCFICYLAVLRLLGRDLVQTQLGRVGVVAGYRANTLILECVNASGLSIRSKHGRM